MAANPLTQALQGLPANDPKAAEALLPLVYAELRQLAGWYMSSEAPGHTLQPTALVHEAWMRLGGEDGRPWKGRGHFVAAAAEAMRRILIDRARKRGRVRHGGVMVRVNLELVDLATTSDDDTLLRLNDAIDRLALHAPDKAELVKLRYFAGLNVAEALGIAPSTARRHWAYARAWLHTELRTG
jgi:RNA polymerase sigma factor (TIGR02999 family)